MVREMEVIQNHINTKSQSVLLIGRPSHNTKFQWNQLITFAVIVLTERHKELQNDWQANRPDRITCVLVEVQVEASVVQDLRHN